MSHSDCLKQIALWTSVTIIAVCLLAYSHILPELLLGVLQIAFVVIEISVCGVYLFRKYRSRVRAPFILAIALVFVKLIDGAFAGLYWRFFIDMVVLLAGGIYLLNNRVQKLLVDEMLLLLFAPVSIVFLPMAAVNIWLALNIPLAFVLVWIYSRATRHRLWYAIACFAISAFLAFAILPSLFHFQNTSLYEKSILSDSRLTLPIVSADNDTSNLAELAMGRIIVLDVWYSKCGICFKKFPEFEQLTQQYSDDPEVYFAGLNIPMESESENAQHSFELVQKYSFPKWQAIATTEQNQWRIDRGYPTILIFDKRGTLRYSGALNIERTLLLHNMYRLIDKLKQE